MGNSASDRYDLAFWSSACHVLHPLGGLLDDVKLHSWTTSRDTYWNNAFAVLECKNGRLTLILYEVEWRKDGTAPLELSRRDWNCENGNGLDGSTYYVNISLSKSCT